MQVRPFPARDLISFIKRLSPLLQKYRFIVGMGLSILCLSVKEYFSFLWRHMTNSANLLAFEN